MQHEPPASHEHLCYLGCGKPYQCSKPECRRLKWYSVCPRCYLRAQNEFNTYKAYTVTRINDPAEEEVKKGHKKLFNPRPKQPTLQGE